MKRKTFHIGIAVFSVFLVGFNLSFPANIYAWGPEGHEVVATIASKHLTPKAKQGVKLLLGTQSLASIANFADVFRQTHKETAEWHFVDIEITDNDYVPSRDCKENVTNEITTGDCVVEAVKHFREVLADKTQSKAKRVTALKFLVHFVGDMHQPLHDADNNDQGGNKVKVTFFGKATNLHSLWDGGIISKHGLASGPFATQLEKGISASDVTEMQKGDLQDWVLEAHKLAQDNAYKDIPKSNALGKPYFDKNLPVVEKQLTRGGLRLAKILNEVFQ